MAVESGLEERDRSVAVISVNSLTLLFTVGFLAVIFRWVFS